MLRRPIFMVGTMRSGSTLLANCLGAHPQVCYVDFELSGEWSRYGEAPIAGVETDDPYCPALGAEHATKPRRLALHRRFEELLAQESGGLEGAIFLNKNPHLSNKLPYLRAMFPDASLIVTARDLRSTVASAKVLFQLTVTEDTGQSHYLPEDPTACFGCSPPLPAGGTDPTRTFPGGDVAVIAEYWLRTYEAIDQHMDSFRRLALIRHHDFVHAPQAMLRAIVDELNLPVADIELPVAIDPARNRRWREILTDDEQESLERFISRHEDRIQKLLSADPTL